jgi:hypothetical protein
MSEGALKVAVHRLRRKFGNALRAEIADTVTYRQRYACESELGASLVGQKDYAEAEPLLLNGYKGLVRTQSVMDGMYAARIEPRMTAVEAAGWIARMYEEWGKPQQAAEWRERAETAR